MVVDLQVVTGSRCATHPEVTADTMISEPVKHQEDRTSELIVEAEVEERVNIEPCDYHDIVLLYSDFCDCRDRVRPTA